MGRERERERDARKANDVEGEREVVMEWSFELVSNEASDVERKRGSPKKVSATFPILWGPGAVR